MVCHQIKLVLTYTLSVQLRSFGMSVILVSVIYGKEIVMLLMLQVGFYR